MHRFPKPFNFLIPWNNFPNEKFELFGPIFVQEIVFSGLSGPEMWLTWSNVAIRIT